MMLFTKSFLSRRAKMAEKEYIEREAIEKAFAKEIHTNYLDDYAKGF